MALILNLETSTKNCSVSLYKDGILIDLIESCAENFSHAETLHLYIQRILEKSPYTFADLSAIAVGKGPGSYTGLRIGVATAKGLAFALKIPLIAVNTLQALALQVKEGESLVIPMIDARRMEVYTAVYNAENLQIKPIEAKIIETAVFDELMMNNKVYFIGDAVLKCKEVLAHENAVFIEGKNPSAKEIGLLSYQQFLNKDFVDVAYFEPFYLKEFLVNPEKKK